MSIWNETFDHYHDRQLSSSKTIFERSTVSNSNPSFGHTSRPANSFTDHNSVRLARKSHSSSRPAGPRVSSTSNPHHRHHQYSNSTQGPDTFRPLPHCTRAPRFGPLKMGPLISKKRTEDRLDWHCSGANKLAFFSGIIFMVFILLVLTNVVESLNCYTCSSADNPGCDEAFTGRANFTDTDCEKQIGKPAKVCRKLVQHIEHKKVVIRSCGWIDEHEDHKPMCYKRSGTFAIMMESCICYEDNCNHSASLVPNQSVLMLFISLILVYYYNINNLTILRGSPRLTIR